MTAENSFEYVGKETKNDAEAEGDVQIVVLHDALLIVKWDAMANIKLVQIVNPIVHVHGTLLFVFQELLVELDLSVPILAGADSQSFEDMR